MEGSNALHARTRDGKGAYLLGPAARITLAGGGTFYMFVPHTINLTNGGRGGFDGGFQHGYSACKIESGVFSIRSMRSLSLPVSPAASMMSPGFLLKSAWANAAG